MADYMQGATIHITGIVQGVGFRPFVFGLAERLSLLGWVRNSSAGVDIEIDGSVRSINQFIDALWENSPPLAHIDDITVNHRAALGFHSFEIVQSQGMPDAFQPISPDVGVCPDCLNELFNPKDRRFHYPFINCTNCGPRFTIIQDVPYDRPNTTMAGFKMCEACAAEYSDPRNRRFHAQPIACPDCGPQVWLEIKNPGGTTARVDAAQAISTARKLLAEGKIVAVKGLGGFHLACDATNAEAVAELRRRKLRVDKAFAIMMPNLKEVEKQCMVGSASRKLLESTVCPVVILDRRSGSFIAREVAPGQDTLGVILPYTPLHHLLIEPEPGFPPAIVMTSGNLSEEPIASDNQEALTRLGGLADAFLLHNRDIHMRCDDSVVTTFQGAMYPIRRSRGYSPFPVHLPWESSPMLATGAELKNTFCLARGRYAFISHHIGDLENYETLQSFERGISHFERLFRVTPTAIAYDLHPDYMATRYALARAGQTHLPAIGVQHHHAHIAACMLEYKVPADEQVIGVSFDGTGYGEDGAAWGGEFMLATYTRYERPFHLAYVPLPGGNLAIKEPWRMALSWLESAGIPWDDEIPSVRFARGYCMKTRKFDLGVLEHQIKTRINSPLTSSMGRLFDTVASLLGLRHTVNYEAQAAIELEALVAPHEFGIYPINIHAGIADPTALFHALISDLHNHVSIGVIAARFHNSIAMMVHDVCRMLRNNSAINKVALSGGVWQNRTLLGRTVGILKNDHFEVYVHHQVPANDGGLALGQAAVAHHRLCA